MFYDNLLDCNKLSYKSIGGKSFDGINVSKDKNLLSMEHSPLTYNFDFSKGVLMDGMGVGKLKFKCNLDSGTFKELSPLPDGYHPTVCWHFNLWASDLKTYRSLLFVLGSDGYVYYNWLHTASCDFIKIENLYFDDIPYVFLSKIDNTDALYFVSRTNGTFVWLYPNIVKNLNNMPIIDSVCVYNNKYFATIHRNKGVIIYSNDLNPINLNLTLMQGGEIRFDDGLGACNKVIAFKGDLYVFRNFNIMRVTEYSNKDDYSVSQIYASNGRIYENTISVCGDEIVYLASDGLYKFDGNTSKKLDLKLDGFFVGVDNNNAVSGYVDGNYYLSCRLNYNDNGGVVDGEISNVSNINNALVKINLESENISIFRGYNVVGIYIVNDIYRNEVCLRIAEVGGLYKLGMLENTGKYYDEVMTKVWCSSITDLGAIDRNKLVKDISFESKQDLQLKVIYDDKVKVYNVRGKNVPQTIKLNIKCKKFGFVFVSKKCDNFITSPKFKVSVL